MSDLSNLKTALQNNDPANIRTALHSLHRSSPDVAAAFEAKLHQLAEETFKEWSARDPQAASQFVDDLVSGRVAPVRQR